MSSLSARPCWCGNTQLLPFNTEYVRCPRCETLVFRGETAAAAGRVIDDEADYYGRNYWFGHQHEMGLANIADRSRHDLPGRCLHWLRTLLRYRQPPGRTLELGCSHGGFVALLRSVGFDAGGLELSPAIAEFARQTFGVNVAVGPIEDQAFEDGALDVVLAMDVLEHLADPRKTIARCVELLRPDGLLIIQTPCYPEGQTYEQLQEAGSPFLSMLLPKEHIYLFSRGSIRALLERAGCAHVTFETAMFAAYDMFLVASRIPPQSRPESAVAATLAATGAVEARLVLGMLDVDRERATLTERLAQAEADGAARLQNTETLEALLTEANEDRAARLELLQRAEKQIAMFNDGATSSRIEEDRRAPSHQQFEQMLETMREALAVARAEVDRWRASASASVHTSPRRVAFGFRRQDDSRPLVAVDVTPILPGSENGGAKGFVLVLLDGLLQRGRHRYVLLTTPSNHDTFAAFEHAGMRRLCLMGGAVPPAPRRGLLERLGGGRRKSAGGSLGARGVELLFCPMTDPVHAEPGLPVVSTVYDLQHLEYPSFFTASERANRDAFFRRVTRAANLVVCISEFTRREVLERLQLAPERVRAIPIAIHSRLVPPSAGAIAEMRARLGIGDAPYAFYPANGWPHKNHRLLLVGFAQVVAERPELPLNLVLAGNLLDLGRELQMAVAQMGLAGRVHIVGFVSDEDLAALWRGAFCLLFPSLYEGFGVPLLEAMQFGTPIVCSDVPSLSQVAGDAARYIDPRRPADIGAALKELFDQPELRRALIQRGGERLKAFHTADMVDRYLEVLDEALAGKGHAPAPSLEGMFEDRWLGPIVTAQAGPSPDERTWEFDMTLPDWLPHPRATVRADVNGRRVGALQLVRGKTGHLQVRVPKSGGHVRLEVTPSFVPQVNGDHRELTVQLVRGQLLESATGNVVHEV